MGGRWEMPAKLQVEARAGQWGVYLRCDLCEARVYTPARGGQEEMVEGMLEHLRVQHGLVPEPEGAC